MLEKVKYRLRITWQDIELDKDLLNLIDESMSALNALIGRELDYTKKDNFELLVNRIRYAYNNSIEYFEENFKYDLLRLQLRENTKNDRQKNADETNQ